MKDYLSKPHNTIMINQKLVEHLKNGFTLLTPTRRLASRLAHEMSVALAKNYSVWKTPQVYALEDWFKILWDQFEIEGEVNQEYLNSMQSLLCVEEIIQNSERGKILFQPQVTAKTVWAAWKICHQWLALNLLEEKTENKEVQAFQEWAKSYQKWLFDNQLIDKVQLPSELLQILLKRQSQTTIYACPSKKIVLFGFEEFSPFMTFFFETLSHHDWQVVYSEPEAIQPELLCQKAFLDQTKEWQAAAIWAKQRLTQKQKNIAIVTPHLTNQRNQIEQIFNDCLTPCHISQPDHQVHPLFNISTAIPFIQYPIIQGAFDLLKLVNPSLSKREYLKIVTSPFTKGSDEELITRADYVQFVKDQPHLSKIDKAYLKSEQEKRPPLWHSLLIHVETLLTDFSSFQSYGQWAIKIRKCLAILGWPGDKALNSVEHQAVKRWEALLNEFQFCDRVLKPATFPQALQTLQKLVANVPFQAENKGAPVQILGILEAAGQHFDHLWVMGMHSQGWPPIATPNPFLPLEVQRLQDMPHASAQRELQYAKKVTLRLQESAKEIIFSYPLQENEKILEQSELIAHIPWQKEPETLPEQMNRAEDYFAQEIILEKRWDGQAPALTENEKLSFNSNTLALQAACPFKAFAQIRLNIKEPFQEQIGLNPQQQGILIHRILDSFWKVFKNQTTLLAESEENLQKKLHEIIEHHTNKILREDMPLAYIQVEKNRLMRLLKDYLAIEKGRAPFEIVELESQKNLNLSGMHFTFRLDRIDKTQQGDYYIIDYKTGQFHLSYLWGERPLMPQLPLYYLCLSELNPTAIFVTKIHTQGCSFEGISQDNVAMPGIKTLTELKDEKLPTQWQDLKAYWTMQLNDLAQAFQQGDAQVSPLEKPKCEYCHLKPFCRVGELA